MNNYFGKTVLVYGRGVSGTGAKRLLERENARVIVADDNDFCAIDKRDIQLIVISPGVAPDNKIYSFAKGNKIPIISETDLGYKYITDKTIIGVTGTNGKTTTTGLIGSMLRADNRDVCVCGNIGIPLTETLTTLHDIYDMELSSFQLSQSSEIKPHIAVITNISPDHIIYHKTMESYVSAKLSIAQNQTKDDYLILSAEDIDFSCLRGFSPSSKVLFTSVLKPIDGAYAYKNWIWFMGEKLFETDRIKLQGIFNVKNVLSAVATVKLLGVKNSAIIDAVTSFSPDNHRLKLIDSIDGISYYNDSKGTNIAASLAAANEMAGDTVILLGGKDKGIEFDQLFKSFGENIVLAVLYGETTKKMIAAASQSNFNKVYTANSLEEAVIIASAFKPKNVLLSPATSSFDMFNNYEERGEAFEAIVRRIGNK